MILSAVNHGVKPKKESRSWEKITSCEKMCPTVISGGVRICARNYSTRTTTKFNHGSWMMTLRSITTGAPAILAAVTRITYSVSNTSVAPSSAAIPALARAAPAVCFETKHPVSSPNREFCVQRNKKTTQRATATRLFHDSGKQKGERKGIGGPPSECPPCSPPRAAAPHSAVARPPTSKRPHAV